MSRPSRRCSQRSLLVVGERAPANTQAKKTTSADPSRIRSRDQTDARSEAGADSVAAARAAEGMTLCCRLDMCLGMISLRDEAEGRRMRSSGAPQLEPIERAPRSLIVRVERQRLLEIVRGLRGIALSS